jgi:hypothetical protein
MANSKTKVSKIMVWPARTIGLPNYGSAKLSAGVEMVFDEPVTLDSKEAREALDEARKFIKEEFRRQYKPYKKLLKGGD